MKNLSKEEFTKLYLLGVDEVYNYFNQVIVADAKIKENKQFDWKSITSVEKAFERVGKDYEMFLEQHIFLTRDVIAFLEMKVVYEAINDGWMVDWSDSNQRKWFPCMEYKGCSGFSFGVSHCTYYRSDAGLGVRLCTDNSKKAEFIGRTFIKQYNMMML